MTTRREPVASQHQPYIQHPHLLSQLQHTFFPSQLDTHYNHPFAFHPHPTYYHQHPTYYHHQHPIQLEQFADDTSAAILSETEQKAFSEFLNQLATDDTLDSPAIESEASSSCNATLCEDFRGEPNRVFSSASSSVHYGYPPNSLENFGTASNTKRNRGLRKNVYPTGNKFPSIDDGTVPTSNTNHRGADASDRRQSSFDALEHGNTESTASYANLESIRSAPTTPSAGSSSSRPATPTIPDSPASTAKRRAPSNANKARSRPSKPAHELLTESEKKANHIASEQRRRQNIRTGFDSLCDIVPTLTVSQRSEALILQKSIDHIRDLVTTKNQIKERIRYLREMLGEPTEPEDDSGSDDGGPEDADYY